MTSHVMKMSRNGQVSIPAETRARWHADRVVVVDLGDRIVIRPLAADAVGDLVGKYAGRGPSTQRARQGARADDARGPSQARVTVLDAFAVLALLRGEPAAPDVRQIIEAGDAQLSTVGVAEAIDHLVRVMKVPEEEAALDLAQLGLIDPPALSPKLALRAGLLRARHYHRTRRAVSLADCIAAETARVRSTELATADPHLLDLCHEEAITALPLPDSTGTTWSP